VRDRSKIIQIPPLAPKDLATVAEAEVRRRHLEPELIAALTRACARGQIKSLRKLHKALDAAEATLRRPRLHRPNFLQKSKNRKLSIMTTTQNTTNLPAVAKSEVLSPSAAAPFPQSSATARPAAPSRRSLIPVAPSRC